MRYFGHGIGHVQTSVRASPRWDTEIQELEKQLGLTAGIEMEHPQDVQGGEGENDDEDDDSDGGDEDDDPIAIDEEPLAELW